MVPFFEIGRLEGFCFILLLLILINCYFDSVGFEKPVRYLSGNFNQTVGDRRLEFRG